MRTLQSFSENLYQELIQQIETIKQNQTENLKKLETIINLCIDYLKSLRELIKGYKRLPKEEEIHFFKVIKPKFVCEFILHTKIYKLHSQWPMGDEQTQRHYLENEFHRINQFFEQNKHFYRYYRSGSNFLDHVYFLRNQPALEPSLYQVLFESDSVFNTPSDLMAAQVLANNHFQTYLEKQLALLTQNKASQVTDTPPLPALTWTESKSAAVEMIYALHVCRVFNGGNADIKSIATVFGKIFNIDLKNIYDACLHIKMRKTELTKFLNKLTIGLTKELSDQH